MKRFQSRLGGLQRLRSQQEKLAALQLAEARKTFMTAESALASSRDSLQQALMEAELCFTSGVAGGCIQSSRQHTQARQFKVQSDQHRMLEARQQLDTASSVRKQAWQDLEVVRQAATRERNEYRKQLLAEELAERVDRVSQPDNSAESQSADSVRKREQKR